MNPSELPSNQSPQISMAQPSNPDTLIASEQIQDQTNLETLQSQLEKAHQLLAYQDTLIQDLTEQVTTQAASLDHCEKTLAQVQRERETQNSELAAMQSVCDDLRSLLLRQKRRPQASRPQPNVARASGSSARSSGFLSQRHPAIPDASSRQPHILKHVQNLNPPAFSPPSSPSQSSEAWISLEQDSPHEQSASIATTKSPPVKVWRADDPLENEGNPLGLLRKLSTLLGSASRHPMEAVTSTSVRSLRESELNPSRHRIELPNFSSV